MDTGILLAALRYPFRPAAELRLLLERGAALQFAVAFALLISVAAGFRSGLAESGGTVFGWVQFGRSLGGFVLLPLVALQAGRLLGGRGGVAPVAAAIVGSGVPFLLVDGLWCWFLESDVSPTRGWIDFLWAFERLSWLWALVLLVLGLAEAHGLSRLRALACVGVVALVLAALVGLTIGAHALAG